MDSNRNKYKTILKLQETTACPWSHAQQKKRNFRMKNSLEEKKNLHTTNIQRTTEIYNSREEDKNRINSTLPSGTILHVTNVLGLFSSSKSHDGRSEFSLGITIELFVYSRLQLLREPRGVVGKNYNRSATCCAPIIPPPSCRETRENRGGISIRSR